MSGHDDQDGRDDGAPDAGERRTVRQVAAGYRSATDALDERPSAHARAAILAAAAREIGAQPRDAAAGPPPARPLKARSALRWPMAAAATVLLSSVAVMMASRVEEAQQVAESAAPPVAAPVVPPVAEPAAPPLAASVAPAVTTPVAPVERPVAPPSASASPAPMADSRGARENTAPIAAAPFADSPRERSVMQAPPPAPPVPASSVTSAESAASATGAGAAGALSRDLSTLRKPEVQTQERPRLEARSAPGAAPNAALGAAQHADAAPPDSEEAALSADDWLARIVRLRETGRHAEADAQLQRFRQRYPQIKVPEAALPPTGTR